MIALSIFLIILAIIGFYLSVSKINKRGNDKNVIFNLIDSIPDFKCTQKEVGIDILGELDKGIAADEENSNLALVSKIDNEFSYKIIPFNQVVSTEIIEDEISVGKFSKSGAVIGGVIAGGAGAIIGGLGNKKNNDKVKKLGLKIVLDSISEPEFVFYSINSIKPINKNSAVYVACKKAIDQWHSIMTIVIKRGQKIVG